jgi:hypothetical protein
LILNRILVATVLCCAAAGAAAARPVPTVGANAGGSYSHALAALARRDAFWRTHPHGRDPETGQDEAAERRAEYWQAQERSRAACGAFGTCQ